MSLLLRVALLVLAAAACLASAGRGGAANPYSRLDKAVGEDELEVEPRVRVLQAPGASFKRYRTFAVVPRSSWTKAPEMNPIIEQQLLFLLRNTLEARGYMAVDVSENPDLIATALLISSYKESYVPPESYSVPVWNSGQTSTSNTQSSGNANAYGSGGYAWGTYSGNSTTTTTTPGYWSSQTYESPARIEGSFFPVVRIDVYDVASSKLVWTGTGVGASQNGDERRAGQALVVRVLGDLPKSSAARAVSSIGIGVLILTPDGNSFYPVVKSITAESLADRAGLEEGDILFSIDGESVANLPYAEVLPMLDAATPGSELVIKRDGNKEPFKLPKGDKE